MKKKVISANQICIYLLYKLYLLDVFVKDVFWTWTSCGYLLVFTAWWPLVPTCPQMSQGRPFFKKNLQYAGKQHYWVIVALLLNV